MAEELIDKFIDRTGIASDKEFILTALNEINTSFNKLQGIKISFEGAKGMKDIAKVAKDLEEANKKLAATETQLAKARLIAAKAMEAEEKAAQANLRTQKLQEQASDKTAKTKDKEGKAAEKLNSTYNQLNARYKIHAAIAQEMGAKYGATSEQFKLAAERAQKLHAELLAIDQGVGKSQRNVGNYASAFNGLNHSVSQVVRELPSINNGLNVFFSAIGNNVPMLFDEFKKIQKESKELDKTLKENAKKAAEAAKQKAILAGETEKAANKTAKLAYQQEIANAAATKGKSAFRQLISSITSWNTLLVVVLTLLPVLSQAATSLFSAFSSGKKNVNELAESQKSYNKVLGESATKLADAKVEFNEISEKVQLGRKGFIDKDEVLKEYNDTIGRTIGFANNLVDAEKKLIELGPKYIQLTYLKAQAEAAGELAKAEAAKSAQAKVKELQDFADTGTVTSGLFKSFFTQINPFATQQDKIIAAAQKSLKAAAKEKDKQIEEAESSYTRFADLQKKLIDDAAGFAKDNGLQFYEQDKLKSDKKNIKTIGDALADLRKELAKIKENETIGQITPTEGDIERVKAYGKAFDQMFERGGNAKTPLIQQLLGELNPISTRVLERQLQEILNGVEKNVEPIEIPVEPKSIDEGVIGSFIDDEIKLYQEIATRQSNVLATEYAEQQKALLLKHISGKLSEKDYQEALLRLQVEYSRKSIQELIKYAEIEAQLAQGGTKAKEDAEKKLAELRLQLLNLNDNAEKESYQRRLGRLAEYLSAAQTLVNDVTGAIGNIADIRLDREKAINEERLVMIERTSKAELDAINASSRNEEQKAAAIALLNARTQSQKEAIDRRNRQLEIEKARFDKAANIANIITGTTLAVVNTLKDPKLITLGINIPLAIAVGALGAAQLAKAIATPLPKYKRGTGFHAGGLAIVGDGGQREVVEEPGGKTYTTPATDTVMNLPRGSKVYPSIEAFERTMAAMAHHKHKGIAGIQINRGEPDNKNIERKLDGVINAVKGNRPVFNKTWENLTTESKLAEDWNNYLDTYVRGK